MPRIPTYQRNVSIPGQSPNVRANPAAAGRVGGDISQAAEVLAMETERIQAEERHYSTLRIGNMVNEEALTYEQEGQNRLGVDAYNSVPAVDEWEKTTKEKFTSNLNDRKVRRDVEQHIQARAFQLKDSLSRHESRQRDLVAEDTRIKTLSSATKDAYQGSGTMEENFASFNNAIINDPRLRDTDKENKLIAGQSAIAASRLDGLIDRNPEAAADLIETGLFNPYLDKKKLEHFHAEIERARKDAKARQKEADRLAKEQLKEDQAQTGNEFVARLVDGGLTQRDIVNSNLDPTGENSKQYWLGQVRQRNKKPNEAWKTDPEVEADLFTRITQDPNAVTDEELLNAQGQGLSTNDTKALLKYRNDLRLKDPLKSEVARTAITRLRDAKTADLFSGNEEENSKKWADSANLLKRYIINNPEADPDAFVDKLLEGERDGWFRRVVDGLPGVEPFQSEEERRQELEAEAGAQIPGRTVERKKGPAMDEWMAKAKEANPDASDEELTTYYRNKYGNR